MRLRRLRRHLEIGLILLLSLGMHISTAAAQQGITVLLDEHAHTFGESMTFRLSVQSDAAIQAIRLFYRVSGQTSAQRIDLSFDAHTQIEVEHVEDMHDEINWQPPMIEITYWWVIEDAAGRRLKTDPIEFAYQDTRYTWQVLQNEWVSLYWHDQAADWGQMYLDLAAQAAADLQQEFGVHAPDPVIIVIYNSHEELMSVLREASAEWTGAVTFGRSGCIAIGLGNPSWMKRVIPHELTHAVLYMITQPPFGDIPRWLHEGLAMRSEGGMSAEEQRTLAAAIKNNTLISLRTLNSPFADDRERAILSYAESNSLIDFIVREYGTHKLGELIKVFAQGAHYDDALNQVFGVDMNGLEDEWRASIGAPPRSTAGQATATPQVTATHPSTRDPVSTPAPAATATAAASSPSFPCTPCICPTPVVILGVLFILFRTRSPR